MRKTKIVCTLGPATDRDGVLKELMLNGMNVARINFSHGNHEEQLKRIGKFKKLRKQLNLPIALMIDTKGPEIRIKTFKNGKVELIKGEKFTLTTKEIEGDHTIVTVTYQNLPSDIKIDDKILLDDGLIELAVVKVKDTDIICEIINGGILSNHKSLNIPNANIRLPYMSEQDKKDIIFAAENDFDFIAASFVRTAYDVFEIKKVLDQNNGSHILVIAKIENKEGVANIDEIMKYCNGIMVARGDMGVEIQFEELPAIQKMLIKKCYTSGKMVITATQMLDSMIRNPRPTRAETTDIANAIYDGTSAIMLSGETAAGLYPVESLKTMAKIARYAEQSIDYVNLFNITKTEEQNNVTNAISHATCMTAHDLGASAIIAITKSGHTARMISKYRPACPIIAATISEKSCRQLSLSWGVYPVMAKLIDNSDTLFEHAVDLAISTNAVKSGDLVVIAGGIPVGVEGTTNMIKVHLVGRVMITGTGVTDSSVSGRLCVVKSDEQAIRDFEDNDILVVKSTNNAILPIMKRASGIIAEEGGLGSHAAVVGMTLEIPVIVGAKDATTILESGKTVTMEARRGLVYCGVTKVL